MNDSIHFFLKESLEALSKRIYNQDPLLIAMLDDLRLPKYYIGDLGVDRNTFSYWLEKGLIPFREKKSSEGWRKFSFLECIWLKVILEFRDLGIGVDKIKMIKDTLFCTRAYAEILVEAVNKGTLSHVLSEDQIQMVKSASLDKVAMEVENTDLSVFDIFIVTALITKQGYGIGVGKDGGIHLIPVGRRKNEVTSKNVLQRLQDLLSGSFVMVNIWPLILDLLFKEGIKVSAQLTNQILSAKELDILSAIRSGNYSEISVKLNKGGEPVHLELKKEGVDHNTLRKLYAYLGRGKYNHISFKTKDGYVINYEETQIIKFKK
jgi:DNA-binding transcriptional MerR regulator